MSSTTPPCGYATSASARAGVPGRAEPVIGRAPRGPVGLARDDVRSLRHDPVSSRCASPESWPNQLLVQKRHRLRHARTQGAVAVDLVDVVGIAERDAADDAAV